MIRHALLAAVLLLASPAAFAAGTDSPTPPSNPDYAAAVAKVKAGDYGAAIALLDKALATEPKNPDVLNQLGYTHRKTGELDKAKGFYTRALAIDPDHRGAHEYIGELYLTIGDVAKAEEHLARLDKICLFGCDEYRDLKKAVAAYKAAKK